MIRILLYALGLWAFYHLWHIVLQLRGDVEEALRRESAELDAAAPALDGMSVHERLDAAGLRDEFRRAVRARDPRRIDRILRLLDETGPALPPSPSDPS